MFKLFVVIFLTITALFGNCKTLNISGKNISTMEILQRVAKDCELSLFVKDEQAQKLLDTKHKLLMLNNFELHKLLNLLLEDVFFEIKDGVLSLFSSKSKTYKIDYIISTRNGKSSISASIQKDVQDKDENSIISVEVFDFWSSIEKDLTNMLQIKSSENSLIIDKNAGLVVVEATKKKLGVVDEYLGLLKKRLSKQVLLSLSIISVSLNKEHKSGVDWSKFSLSINSKNTNTLVANGNNPTKLVWNNSTNLLSNIDFSMEGLINF